VKGNVRKAFLGTGKPYAVDTFWSVNRVVGEYVRSWIDMYRDTCEATHVRGEQSDDVLDLRMSCLDNRLGSLKALTQVFAQADGAVVENAAVAASQLNSIEHCADVKLLRQLLPPPDDGDARERVAELQLRLAAIKALRDAGRVGDAAKLVGPVADEARREGYGPLLAEALKMRGMILYEFAGDVRGAEAALEEALWTAEASRHDEMKAEVSSYLVAYSGGMEGRFADGERWRRMTEATLRRIGGHERLNIGMKTSMGLVYDTQGRFEEALQQHQEALAIGERALRPDDPEMIAIHGNIAMMLGQLGRTDEALRHSDKAIELTRRALGAEHPFMGNHYTNRGEILNGLGRWQEAQAAFTRAQAIWEKQMRPEHLHFAYPLTGIGLSYLGERQPERAVAPLERALTIRRAHNEAPKRLGETLFALARALWESGQDKQRAHALASEARDAYKKVVTLRQQLDEVTSWLSEHGPVISTRARDL
jgi:tetratricopeptide (TPR) repeat protein